MKLIRYLLSTARSLMIVTSIIALISGACNAGLIAVVNYALSHPETSATVLVLSFVALGFGKLGSNLVSQVMLARFSQDAIAGLRRDLVQKILAVPLRQVEEVGTPRLMVALTEDILNITQALLGIPMLAVNLAILIGGAIYMSWLSWQVAIGMGVFILVGAIGYRLLISRGFGFLMQAREEEDRLFSHFRALTDGLKELKLHRNRRHQFLEENVQRTMDEYSRHNVCAEKRFILAQGWSQLFIVAVVGLILFVLPLIEHISRPALTGYVVTTLYLMGPLAGVLGSLSVFGRANAAFDKIDKLGFSLAANVKESCPIARSEKAVPFEKLELVGVTHSYHREREDSHFMIGPIDLAFEPGELVFLVGGNGSGKSTLAKIITGLYPPEAGEIWLNGKPVTDETRDDYRQCFSAVFADFFVFETLLGLESNGIDSQAREYLKRLHLDHKVKIRNGALSTTALSQGQRKRLALLTAYLERRPIYLFDEWASDQDPLFKEIFYRQILPELKALGKTCIVITHDDAYFDVADRILKLDYGQLVYDKQQDQQPRHTATSEPLLHA